MGEWSDYFEDYPEEDMGNYLNGVFDPELARQRNSSFSMPHTSEHEKKLRREQYKILMRSKGIEIKD